VTALCGLAATLAWLTLGGGVVGNVDFIALATLFTAVVGASLAWYLPQAAASRRYDPMAEALNARIAMLVAAALGMSDILCKRLSVKVEWQSLLASAGHCRRSHGG
jgi:hypothetical protein